MKNYARYVESDEVDWSRICDDPLCQRTPNRCDHIGIRKMLLSVVCQHGITLAAPDVLHPPTKMIGAR
jgi:hypothetical protein